MKKNKEEQKVEKKTTKKKIDLNKLATRVIAGMMVGLMLFGICGTVIYYIIKGICNLIDIIIYLLKERKQ